MKWQPKLEETLSNFYPFVGWKIVMVVKNCDELFADSCESDRTLEPDDDKTWDTDEISNID